MAAPSPHNFPVEDPDHEVILVWRGLKVTLTVARLCIGGLLTVFFAVGCFWILLSPSGEREDQAAIALLSTIVTAWVTALARART